ncbi:MAG: DNA repair protein RadC [Patescibacteria group bacterium]|nr:DNA repair protein RadC [Patescibacteria group bacterium]
MKLKEVPMVDRPREKLTKYGVNKLSDTELMAILIRTGIKGKNVVELSKQILKIIEKNGVDKITMDDLTNVKGLGKTKAGQILASVELGRRLLKGKKSELILSAQDVWNKMEDLRDSKKEHFVIFYLDTQNQIIEREIISVGTLNESLIHPREVFEPAIAHSAAQVIVAHNHPSGNLKSSPEDIAVTKRLTEAGTLLGIEILDHVIVSRSGFKSLNK